MRNETKLSYIKGIAVISFFLFITRGILSKYLTYSDFVPFSPYYNATLERFLFTWNKDFVGLFDPKSISYLISDIFEILAFNNAIVAQDLYILTFFLIGYYGMYTLLKRCRVHPVVNFIIPFFYIVNPVMAAELSNGVTAMLVIYAFTPLLFITFADLLQNYSFRRGFLFSMIIALLLMNMQMSLWIMVGLLLFLVAHIIFGGIRIKNLIRIFLHACLGILFNAIALLSFFGISESYASISYLETFKHTYQKTDFYNLFRLIGNNGSSQPLLGYFNIDLFNLVSFLFFGIIIIYFLSINKIEGKEEKTIAVFAIVYLLVSMMTMNLIKAGDLDTWIMGKNLLLVSARNPQKIFYLFAFCYVLLLGLSLSSLVVYVEKKLNRKAALIMLLLIAGMYLGQNKSFLSGDFGLTETRGDNNYFIESKYAGLFAQMKSISHDSKILYLPFDYELQLKTFWQDNLVKYKMGGNMLDSERNSDMLLGLYGDICQGENDFKLVNDKLNIDYIVLDKHPTTYIRHNRETDCTVESYYETPYIWGKYEYFEHLFAQLPVYYEDEDFKILENRKKHNPEVFAIDDVVALNNADNIDLKYNLIKKELHKDFNFVVKDTAKSDHFATLEELFYKSSNNMYKEKKDLSLNQNFVYFNKDKKNLFYDADNDKLKILSKLENDLYLNDESLGINPDGQSDILYNGGLSPERKYFIEINSRLVPVETGKEVDLGIINSNDSITLYSVADPQRSVFDIKLNKTNLGKIFYYNDSLWRAGTLNARILQKSTDGGKTWTDLHTFDKSVGRILVTANGTILIPQDPNDDYWTDPPADIYLSADGGATFTKVLTLNRGGVSTWSFDIKDESILLAEYGEYGSGHVYMSKDSGHTWKLVFTVPSEIIENAHIHKVLFDPYLDKTIYISNGDMEANMRVWYSRDDGENWKIIDEHQQPTWIEATKDYIFLLGDRTGIINRIKKEDLFNGRYTIETVYDASKDTRAQFGQLSFYAGRIDSYGNIYAGGVAYGANDPYGNNKEAALLASFDNGNSWNILKIYDSLPDISSGASFLSRESNDHKIYVDVNNEANEILYLDRFDKSDVLGKLQKGIISTPYSSKNDNLILSSSFQEGLWNSEVADCNAYDDNPVLSMELETKNDSDDRYLELAATRHVACTTNNFPVQENMEYLFSFDYQSPNAKMAGYFLQFNDEKENVISERIFLDDTEWRNYMKKFTTPAGATMARLFLYAYATDEKTRVTNNYDNFSLLKLKTEKKIDINYKPEFENRTISLDKEQNIFNYKRNGYIYGNTIANGSFEKGLWQETVEDCHDYDDNPDISMHLSPDASEGEQSLELRATRHTACASKAFPVKKNISYLLGFDYKSPADKQAGYYLEFNDADRTILSGVLNVETKGWQKFEKVVKTPLGATSARLYVYAYESDKKTNNVVRYDNFKFMELPDLEDRYYFYSDIQSSNTKPQKIEFETVNPTKKLVHIKGASTSFFLAMSQSYHAGWQLEINNGKVQDGLNSWSPFAKPDKLDDRDHLKLNNFLNAWHVDTVDLCQNHNFCSRNPDGTYDIEMVIEFTPQRWFYLLLLISVTTFLGCLACFPLLRFKNYHFKIMTKKILAKRIEPSQ